MIMPTITRLDTCTINLYAGDHLPPHFHVRMNDGREALVSIEPLEVLRGSISKRELGPAIAWADANKPALLAAWKELNP